jgi:excinuclease ABC subunit C
MFDIKENLKKLPDTPGVYIHKDKKGRVIYVGKASSLRNRVRQYFGSPRNMDAKVRAMVAKIAEFEIMETRTEMEALILECNLIKKYMPKYNVMLRDDKTYPYIKMTLGEEYPRLLKTRLVKKDGGRYFGPYANANAVNQMVDLLNGIYGLKRCSTSFQLEEKTYRPCLNYHIHQCQGICSGKVSKEKYRESVHEVMDFLSGKKKPLVGGLKEKMNQAAHQMAFEEAAYYRDLIQAAEAILELANSPVAKAARKSAEMEAREGAKQELETQKLERTAYAGKVLREWTGHGTAEKDSRVRIEAYDISTSNGVDSVGAMVVFTGGKPLKKAYRRFRVRTEGMDDVGSLQEVLYRRLSRGLSGDGGFVPLPDYILMDGGKGQVSAGEKVVTALDLSIPVLGMIKDDRHRTKALLWKGQERDLKTDRELYRQIGSIQEEVHRFAVEYHRNRQEKRVEGSELDRIPGVGAAKRNALLQHFQKLDKIQKASVQELMEVSGIHEKLAMKIYEYFN